jgi:BlaI family transcriptional regulator, penicillinase repressor
MQRVTSISELGPLEMEVLGLFVKAHAQGVTEIQKLLAAKGNPLAYTTVMTVLSRLYDKGALTRSKEGKRFVYSAARGSAAIKNGILKRVKAALFQGTGIGPVTALLDAERLSEEELRELRRWVDTRLKEKRP